MVEIVSKYTAKVQKADGWWVIEVPEIGYCTQARNYSELNTMTRDLIKITTDDEDIDVTYEYDLPSEVAEAVELKRQAAELGARAMRTQGIAAKKLHDMGVSLRDIGALLGISHQRAHQLVKAR